MRTNPLSILISDHDAATRRELRAALEKEGHWVAETSSGDEAVAQALREPPDLAILELDLPEYDGLRACSLLRNNPATRSLPIVLLSPREQVDERIAGFEAGADDCLGKPFYPDELAVRIRRLIERCIVAAPDQIANHTRARIIAVCGAKGGVGKTTFSVNLAVALAKRSQKRVAVFDADFYFGNVGVQLNLAPVRSVMDLTQRIDVLDPDLIDQVLLSHPSGVRVLASPARPAQAAEITSEHVRVLVHELGELFDYVVVDCQTNIDQQLIPVMQQADEIMIVATPEIGCLKNTSNLLEVIPELNVPLEKVHIVLNRATSRVGLRADEIEQTLRRRIEYQLCDGGAAVAASINQGVPLVLVQPQHRLSVQVTQIADQIISPSRTTAGSFKNQMAVPWRESQLAAQMV